MKGWLTAFVLAQALDGGVTCVGLARGSLREVNPFVPGRCAGVVAVKVGTSLPALVGLPKLAKTRPKLAKGIAISMTVGMAAVSGWNMKEMRRQ